MCWALGSCLEPLPSPPCLTRPSSGPLRVSKPSPSCFCPVPAVPSTPRSLPGNQTPYLAIHGPAEATAPPAVDQWAGTICSPPQAEKSEARRSPAGPGVLNRKQHPVGTGLGQMPGATLLLPWSWGCREVALLVPGSCLCQKALLIMQDCWGWEASQKQRWEENMNN